jgi:hypothetical protein
MYTKSKVLELCFLHDDLSVENLYMLYIYIKLIILSE